VHKRFTIRLRRLDLAPPNDPATTARRELEPALPHRPTGALPSDRPRRVDVAIRVRDLADEFLDELVHLPSIFAELVPVTATLRNVPGLAMKCPAFERSTLQTAKTLGRNTWQETSSTSRSMRRMRIGRSASTRRSSDGST